jgi:hypothetical protein
MLAGLSIDPQVASYGLTEGLCWVCLRVGAEFEELFGLKKTFTYRANNFSTTSFVQVFYLPWWHLVSQFNVNRGHKK